jgi:hypothetical protein
MKFAKKMGLISLCYACVLMLLVFMVVRGSLSTLGLAYAVIVTAIVLFFVFLFVIKTARREVLDASKAAIEPLTRRQLKRTIWALRFWIALMVLSFIRGLANVKEGPLLGDVVGIAMNLLITTGCVLALIGLQKKLRNQSDNVLGSTQTGNRE